MSIANDPNPPVEAITTANNRDGRIVLFIESYAAAIVAMLLLACGFIVFKDYLLFHKAYFFNIIGSDSYNVYYPSVRNTADYISKHGMPGWSFNFGMGQSIFPFFLRDPFSLFFYIAGKDSIIFGAVYVELAKIFLGGMLFFYYQRTIGLSGTACITGSLFFSFSGFMIVGSAWTIFSFEAFNMALLLLAFERLFLRQQWYLFPVAVFLLCISQPFNLYIYGFFLACYALLRLCQTDTFTRKDTGAIFLKIAIAGIIGILLSSPFLLENVVQLLESPRGSGTTSYAHALSTAPMFAMADRISAGTNILRFFSSDILGNRVDFNGWRNYLEAPLYYCGLPCLLLLPQVFLFLKQRTKLVFLLFIVLWMLPILLPYFRQAFWLFTGDYYRAYSFFIAFLFIFYSLHALDGIIAHRRISLPVLFITLAVLYPLLCYPYFPERGPLDHPIFVFVCVMLAVYATLLIVMSKKNAPSFFTGIFIFLVATEATYLSYRTTDTREAADAYTFPQKTGYNDYTTDAVAYLQHTDHSFYRVDKLYSSSPTPWRSYNDGMAQGYYGTTAYSPFNQLYYILYLQEMGIAQPGNEKESRWADGLANHPILESENRVKYLLVKGTPADSLYNYYTTIGSFGDVTLLSNKFVLPFGYTYSSYISKSIFNTLSNTQKEITSRQACVVDDADIKRLTGLQAYSLRDTCAATISTADATYELTKDTLQISRFTETAITGNVQPGTDKIMYLPVPYDEGWQLTVDGHSEKKMIVFAGMTGILLHKGSHSIMLAYHLRYFNTGVALSLIGLLLYLLLLCKSLRRPL